MGKLWTSVPLVPLFYYIDQYTEYRNVKTTSGLRLKTLFTVIFTLVIAAASSAQFRDSQPSDFTNTGFIIKHDQPATANGGFLSNIQYKMSHSYEMNFASFGGTYANQNMYTNTSFFQFNPRFSGRFDLAVSHSPFGAGVPGAQNRSAQFFVRNAELNYRLGKNSHITLQYQQNPGLGYFGGYPGFGGFQRQRNSRFR